MSGSSAGNFQICLQFDHRPAGRDRRQPAQPRPALAPPGKGEHVAAGLGQRCLRRVQDHHAGRPIHHRGSTRPHMRGQPHGTQARSGMPKRAQHDRSVTVGAPPSSVATPATRAGLIRAASAGSQPLGKEDRAGRQAGEGAERRPGQVAHQSPRDLPHLVCPACRPAGRSSALATIRAAAMASASSDHRLFRGSQARRQSAAGLPRSRPGTVRASARKHRAAGAISAWVSSGSTCSRARSLPSCFLEAADCGHPAAPAPPSMSAAAIR